MTNLNTSSHEFNVRVYYEDTDAGGIVYYANYLKYFERARTEWLRVLGISQQKYLEQNLGFVVSSVAIDYFASAKLDDSLLIQSTIKQLKKASILFEQHILVSDTIITKASVKVVHKSLITNKPCAIPSTILGALQRVI